MYTVILTRPIILVFALALILSAGPARAKEMDEPEDKKTIEVVNLTSSVALRAILPSLTTGINAACATASRS